MYRLYIYPQEAKAAAVWTWLLSFLLQLLILTREFWMLADIIVTATGVARRRQCENTDAAKWFSLNHVNSLVVVKQMPSSLWWVTWSPLPCFEKPAIVYTAALLLNVKLILFRSVWLTASILWRFLLPITQKFVCISFALCYLRLHTRSDNTSVTFSLCY